MRAALGIGGQRKGRKTNVLPPIEREGSGEGATEVLLVYCLEAVVLHNWYDAAERVQVEGGGGNGAWKRVEL